MLVLTIDVGIKTGFVLSEIPVKGSTPRILISETFDAERWLQPANHLEDMFIAPHIMLQEHNLDWIILENPLTNHYAIGTDLRKRLDSVAAAWQRWLSYQVRERPMLRTKQIQANLWKATPAKTFDVYSVQEDVKWHEYRPTRHERDAASIAYWFANWGMRRL